MKNVQPYRIKTITAYHQVMGLPKPAHPLISVIPFEQIKRMADEKTESLTHDFYSIALKRNFNGKMRYGQQVYDFDEGIMIFISPGQVFSIKADKDLQHTGWLLLIHPDNLWNTALAKAISQYEYFGYAVSEALHLSDKEEAMVTGIMKNIEQEYCSNIDQFSQPVILAQLELLLTYADRFYHRQFITRKITNHQILEKLEDLLSSYINSDNLLEKGLPTV